MSRRQHSQLDFYLIADAREFQRKQRRTEFKPSGERIPLCQAVRLDEILLRQVTSRDMRVPSRGQHPILVFFLIADAKGARHQAHRTVGMLTSSRSDKWMV